MRVLFYRDCRALNRIQIAKATVAGTIVSDAYTVRYRPLSFIAVLIRLFLEYILLRLSLMSGVVVLLKYGTAAL